MKRSIFKYEISVDQDTQLKMPKHAEILHVQSQGDHVRMWVLVNTEAETELRRFTIFGTGWPIEDDRLSYVGTALTMGGGLVWHVFEYI